MEGMGLKGLYGDEYTRVRICVAGHEYYAPAYILGTVLGGVSREFIRVRL